MSAPLAIFVDRTACSTVTGRHRRSDQIVELLRSSGFEVLTVAGRNRGSGTIAYALSCLLFYARATLIIWIKRPNLIWLPVPWPLIIPYTKSILVVDQRDDYITNVAKKSVLLAKALAFLSKGIYLVCEKSIHVSAIKNDGDKHYLPTAITRDESIPLVPRDGLAPILYPSSSRLGSGDLSKRLKGSIDFSLLDGGDDSLNGRVVLIPFSVDQYTEVFHSNRLSDVLSRGALPVFVSDCLPRSDTWFYPLFVSYQQIVNECSSTISVTVSSVKYLSRVREVIDERSVESWYEVRSLIGSDDSSSEPLSVNKKGGHFIITKMIPPLWCWIRCLLLLFGAALLAINEFHITAHTLIVIAFVQLAGFALAEFSKMLTVFLKDLFRR